MRSFSCSVLALAFVACAKSGGHAQYFDLAFLDSGAESEVAQEGMDISVPPTLVTEDFRAVYAYRGRLATGAAQKFEFRVADPRDTDPQNDEVLFASGVGGVDCTKGCFLDKGLGFLAAVKDDSIQVYDIRNPNVPEAVGPQISGVATVFWAEEVLYFSQHTQCPQGTSPVTKCFDIFSFEVKSGQGPKRLTTMPPVEEEGLGTRFQYNGTFSIGEDNKTLIFFVPTYESLSIWIYRSGNRHKIIGPICQAKDAAGNCIEASGSGALYREDNPVGLSRDGMTLVFPLIEDNRQLRLYRYRLGDKEPLFSVLLEVPTDYLKNACYNKEDWQFTEVRGPIRFSQDGTHVYFIGASTCGDNMYKPWTDILALEVSKIGSGKRLTEADFHRVTKNPQGYTAAAIAIFDYDFSPSKAYVLLVGTPTIDMEGNPLPTVKDGRHQRDREIYVTKADGSAKPVQLTNDVEWLAESVFAVGPR